MPLSTAGEKVESDSRHLIQYVFILSSEECQDGHVLNEKVSKLGRDGVEGAVQDPYSRNCLVLGEKTQARRKIRTVLIDRSPGVNPLFLPINA